MRRTWKEWKNYLGGKHKNKNFIVNEGSKAFFDELNYDLARYNLKPKLWVTYLRKPLIGRGKNNLRVTFDYYLKVKRFLFRIGG